jgi:hypothetical protein
VKIRILEIDDLFAVRVSNVGVADIPFAGHGPVENLGTCWNLMNLKRDALADAAQNLSEPIAGDAAADGVKLGNERMEAVSEFRRLKVEVRCRKRGTRGHFVSEEIGIITVAVQNNSFIPGPGDGKSRIIPADATRVLRGENLGHLVKHFGIVGKRLEAMRESLRNI